ncbi:methyltransferase-like protein 24 [Exaiptasia diaphana]|uniref:Methyltransferase domain-containing protein n=1 Tax=Exaiptasia diaphana TaxID=2652724 RepID=A0A913YBP5_EXADI|nr:methyltransferase-like protein 24 [Exaiptasia diaphana]
MMNLFSSRKCRQLISAVIIMLTLITMLAWYNNPMVHENVSSIEQNTDVNRPEYFAAHRAFIKRENTETSIYQYVEEQPAGKGSNIEEYQRLRSFLATQGTICKKIQRIGGAPDHRPYGPDGAWDVCFDVDVGLVPESCIVYSFGIGKDFSFDDGMAHHGCKVYSFDPTIGKQDYQHAQRVYFFNTGLADHDQEGNGKVAVDPPFSEWKTRTLASVIKDLNHSEIVIDIVKMDIESSEWSSLYQMLQDGTLYRKVRQLIVEFHFMSNEPSELRRYYSIIQWLTRQGIKVSSLHQNVYCTQCLEMSFINTKLRQEYNSTLWGDVFAW